MALTERYVSTTGAGAHDGTTAGNAWTLAEAITNAAAGHRVNILSNATYTLGAATTFPNGASEDPIEWRGYNSAIGDLENTGRASATAALTVTDFPVIDGGASHVITGGTFNLFKNIRFTVDQNADGFRAVASEACWRCLFENVNSSGSAATAFTVTADYTGLVDCDFILTSTSSGDVLTVDRGRITGCRAWTLAATPNTASVGFQLGLNASIFNCIAFNVGRGAELNHANTVDHCTFYDCNDGIWITGNQVTNLTNNIIYNMAAYAFTGTTVGNPLMWNNAAGALTSGRINTTTFGTVIEESDSIILTGDPFTNAGSEDFTLNNTSGAGALCRATSQLWAGEGDIGAVQHADAGGGGGGGGGGKQAGGGGGQVG